MLKQLTTASFVVALAGGASAATLFSADLQSASANLNEASAAANRAISYSTTGAAFGTVASGDGGRNVLRTNDTDYNTVDFVAEVTADWDSGDKAVFFGLGKGMLGAFGIPDVDLGDPSWIPGDQVSNVPPAGFSHIALALGNNDPQQYRINGPTGEAAASNFGGVAAYGTTRLRMTHDAGAQTLTYSVDFGYTGTFVADFTSAAIDLSGYDFSDGAAIYFESDDGLAFRDLTIVPEPSSLALLGLGGLMVARRRRK